MEIILKDLFEHICAISDIEMKLHHFVDIALIEIIEN